LLVANVKKISHPELVERVTGQFAYYHQIASSVVRQAQTDGGFFGVLYLYRVTGCGCNATDNDNNIFGNQ